MKAATKIIISCAVTGSIHTPSMSPHLPITPDEIARQSIDAADAGAAILHLHARNADGSPSFDPAVFAQFLAPIAEATNAAINITTGGSHLMTLDERIAAAKAFQPELASLNMGAMIFDYSAAARRVESWRHPWEERYVLDSRDRVMYNTNHYIERICREVGQAFSTRFEFECYDVGHLYTLAHFADLGLVKPPFFIQTIFGILGGIGADPMNLSHMISVADHLFGEDYYLSVFAAGRNQMRFASLGMNHGANIRVGLEDSLFIGPGQLATSNAAQVKKVAAMIRLLDREIATPDEARQMLGLKGKNNTQLP